MLRKLLFITFIFCTGVSLAQKSNIDVKKPAAAVKMDYQQVGAPMPAILLHTLDSIKVAASTNKRWMRKHKNEESAWVKKPIILTEKDLDNNANLLVMVFNPNCGHCQDQAMKFEKDIDLFKKSKLVMMAKPDMREYLPNFIKTTKIKDFYPKILVGVDSGNFIRETFLYSALPQINIYSKDRKLLRAFSGEVPMDTLKMYIQ